MKGNNSKLIIGVIVATLLIVTGLYYYAVTYRNSSPNKDETNISNVKPSGQSSGSNGEGGSGSVNP